MLTRRTISHMDSSHDLLRGLVSNVIKELAELLAFCGIGDPVDNAIIVHRCAVEKLEALFAAARKLNTMIGENVVSEDLVVSFIHGGTIFNGELMEDAYARTGSKSGQRAVICTTDVGLHESKERKGAEKVLLKPKVVLLDS